MSDTPRKSSGDSPVLQPRPADLVLVAETIVDDPAARVAAALRGDTKKLPDEPRNDALNPMLDQLVYGDNDLVGLVAYAMHEVNRRDWCAAYATANGRAPNASELAAYLVGERLERRLETYRRLAEDALAKVAQGDSNLRRLAEGVPEVPRVVPAPPEGPEKPEAAVTASATKPKPMPAASLAALNATASDKLTPPRPPGNFGKLAFYLVLLFIAVAALAYLLRFGIDATQPLAR